MKKLVPLVFIIGGIGAGVAAGITLRPHTDSPAVAGSSPDNSTSPEGAAAHVEVDHKSEKPAGHAEGEHDGVISTNEYAKLKNQFVVPIVQGEKVTALVVLALSIEVPEGQIDKVYLREPKLRDSFLQVLFDHANMGGFEGNFTDVQVLGRLRTALKEVGQRDLGQDLVKDVLIIEIARQDY